MNRLLAWIGGALGAWLGWRTGTHIGMMTAYLLSLLGMGLGYTVVRQVLRHYLGK